MTLPASGTISFSDVNVEIGQSSTYSSSLQFLNGLIKPAQRPSPPDMTAFYNKAYYLKNNDGNCSNGNCTSNCNCGNIQCTNCVIVGGVNCVNCDTQNWLQTNCNCACTYNCATAEVSYNCNCDCSCCVVASALSADGTWDYDRVMELTQWAIKHLDTNWLGERLHRGYHVIGPKYLVPILRSGGLFGRNIAWSFTHSTSMLRGEKFNPLALITSLPWMVVMLGVGLVVTKRYAKRSWVRAARRMA